MAIKAAVVGAGLAGLACASTLKRAGWEVEVFEAEEAVGGRLASMRLGPATFDHGTPYVVPRLPLFREYVADLVERGYAAAWRPRDASAPEHGDELRGPTWYVGVPGMAGLVRPLVDGLRLHTKRPVHTIKRTGKSWHVWLDEQATAGPYAAVAIAVPAPKALTLIGGLDVFEAGLSSVRMAPCWSLQVHLEAPIMVSRDIWGEISEVIRWIARNNTKPRRAAGSECLVIQAAQGWSRMTEIDDPQAVAQELWAEACRLLEVDRPPKPIAMQAHLWRHGFATKSLGETYMYSSEHKLGVAGDWCRGRLAEHAYISGIGLGQAMIASM